MARPAFRGGAAHVRVPATSANLGPGFDALGLALDLHDDVLAVVGEDGVVVDVAGEGTDEVARDEKNLVVAAMRATFDQLGGQPRGIELSCANRIPHGRGLGSSAAAIVAGVLLARALVLGGEQALPMSDVLNLAARLEGHPDNVAACLLGGLTIAWTVGPTKVDAVRVDLDPHVSPFVFIPPTPSSTHAARQALPATVSRGDAVHNLARSALLVAALSGTARTASDAPQRPGDPDDEVAAAITVPADVLLAATEDRLHQQYRRAGMSGSADLIAELRADRIAAVMSGAGPTVLAFTRTAAEVKAAIDAVPPDWAGWAGRGGPGRRASRRGAALVIDAPKSYKGRPCCRGPSDGLRLAPSVHDASDIRRPPARSTSTPTAGFLVRTHSRQPDAAPHAATCGQRIDSPPKLPDHRASEPVKQRRAHTGWGRPAVDPTRRLWCPTPADTLERSNT